MQYNQYAGLLATSPYGIHCCKYPVFIQPAWELQICKLLQSCELCHTGAGETQALVDLLGATQEIYVHALYIDMWKYFLNFNTFWSLDWLN